MASWIVDIYAWSTIWNFFDRASTASDRKGAKIQHEFSWFCKRIFSKESYISPQIMEFKNLEVSEILSSDIPGLRNLSSLIDLSSLCNLTGLNSL